MGLSRTGSIVRDDPSKEEEAALSFLYHNMPDTDRKKLKYDFLRLNTRQALAARADNDWAMDVPWDIFLNYVLPYANLDEPREDWRSQFYSLFSPLVTDTTNTLDAAMELNYKIWTLRGWNITFKSNQTPDIMSPSQVIAAGYASCTGLAIFLVNACRAVGIPARVAGTPSWVSPDPSTQERFANHNWVEVWHNGVWSFTGPIEYADRQWNKTWFFPDSVSRAIPDSYLHSIYAASFKRTNTYFVLAWNEEYDGVPAYDVTKYYLAAARAAAGGSAPPPPVRDAKEMGAVEGVDEEARAGGVWQRDAHAWVHTA